MTMFSFHPVKPITTGEGGVIVTDHEEYYLKLKRFRTHGITTENVRKNEGPWYYEMVDLGYNYRMTDVQAALGLSQLTKLDAFVQKRREIAAMYHEAFSRIPGVRIPYQLPYVDSSWHLYVLQLQLENFRVGRKEIFEALRAENIGVHVHYIPVYFHPYYQQLGYKKGICPVAEKWYEAVLTIPLFPKMSEYDIRTVMEGVNKVLSFYRK